MWMAGACGCGRQIEVKRRHYWRGVAKLHGDCRHKAMDGKRASIAGEKYINGAELARTLGISRSTLSRWVKTGKLPKPKKSISGMLLFDRAVVDQFAWCTASVERTLATH